VAVQLAEAGLLTGSFVPPKPVRALRQLTRYRTTQVAERQREANRLHKALQDTNIMLDCVASDILGVSGRAMLDALVAGTTDPDVLADLAKGRVRQKLPALKEALEGHRSSESCPVGPLVEHGNEGTVGMIAIGADTGTSARTRLLPGHASSPGRRRTDPLLLRPAGSLLTQSSAIVSSTARCTPSPSHARHDPATLRIMSLSRWV
jgi:hypothetical protein